jgi:hypothetical protein
MDLKPFSLPFCLTATHSQSSLRLARRFQKQVTSDLSLVGILSLTTSNTEWFAISTLALHLMLGRAPRCRLCGETTEKRTVSVRNENGNAGRPMYMCVRCDEFACFGDIRGIQEENPICFCVGKMPSRAQVSRPRRYCSNTRTVYYICASGECDFWEHMKDDDGEEVILTGECLDAKDLKRMGL